MQLRNESIGTHTHTHPMNLLAHTHTHICLHVVCSFCNCVKGYANTFGFWFLLMKNCITVTFNRVCCKLYYTKEWSMISHLLWKAFLSIFFFFFSFFPLLVCSQAEDVARQKQHLRKTTLKRCVPVSMVMWWRKWYQLSDVISLVCKIPNQKFLNCVRRTKNEKQQFSRSIPFKIGSMDMRSEKPICASPRLSEIQRVSTGVVVVRELFSLVTSAICVQIRGDRSEVTKLFTRWLRFFVSCCVLITVGLQGPFPLYFAM